MRINKTLRTDVAVVGGGTAGAAAAIAAKRSISVREVSYGELCEVLKNKGR